MDVETDLVPCDERSREGVTGEDRITSEAVRSDFPVHESQVSDGADGSQATGGQRCNDEQRQAAEGREHEHGPRYRCFVLRDENWDSGEDAEWIAYSPSFIAGRSDLTGLLAQVGSV